MAKKKKELTGFEHLIGQKKGNPFDKMAKGGKGGQVPGMKTSAGAVSKTFSRKTP